MVQTKKNLPPMWRTKKTVVGQIVPPDERHLVQLESPHRFEQHRLSGILHLIASDEKFACGQK